MKKIISFLVVIVFTFCHMSNVLATKINTAYITDFESADTFTWANITGEVVTKPYGGNNENKALKIEKSKSLDTLSYGSVIENPVYGNLIFNFDILFDSDCGLAELEKYTLIKGVYIYLKKETSSEQIRVFDFLSLASNNTVRLRLGADDSGTVDIPTNQWHRLQMSFSPTTGKVNFSCIENIDGSGEKSTTTLSDYVLTDPGECSGAERILLNNNEAKSYYVDNIKFSQDNLADSLEIISSTVKNNMVDVLPTDILVFEFNHRIDPCDNAFEISGGNVSIESWKIKGTKIYINLSRTLDYNTTYNLKLTGLSDIYGEEYENNQISFKTASAIAVSDVRFSGKNNEDIEYLDLDYTKYSAVLKNRGIIKDYIYIVVVLYNDNLIEDISVEKIILNPNETFNFSYEFSNLSNNTNYISKVFYFKSLSELKLYSAGSMHTKITSENLYLKEDGYE